MTAEETRAARGCLAGLALCFLSALTVLGVVAWRGWWGEALCLLALLLILAGPWTERPEPEGHVSAGWMWRHRS